MFINQKGNIIYRVSLSIDKVFEPFWSLSKNLIADNLLTHRDYSVFGEESQQDINECILKCEQDFRRNCDNFKGAEKDKQKYVEDEEKSKYDSAFSVAFNIVIEYFLKQILSDDCFRLGFRRSCSLVVYNLNGECRFVTEGDATSTFVEDLYKCLNKKKILENFLSFLDEGIAGVYNYSEDIYRNILPDQPYDDAIPIASPFYEFTALRLKDGIDKDVSDYRIWFNEEVIKKLGYDKPTKGEVFEYKFNGELLGLGYGKYFIPLSTDWNNYFTIVNCAEYRWTDFRNGIFIRPLKEDRDKKKPKTKLTPEEQAFIKAAFSESFTNLLSYLKDNLYLTSDAPEIAGEWEKFFQKLIKVEGLNHLLDYKFYLPRQESGTILGVYKINRQQGDKSFNLRHMLSISKQKEELFINDCYDSGRKRVSEVMTLLPSYATFYLLHYYEFFFGAALQDLKDSGIIVDYCRNQQYAFITTDGPKQCEIDAIVNTGKKIMLFELKTTLHIEHLTDYPLKYASMLQLVSNPELYEFHLVSSFAEDKIAVLNNSPEGDYNKVREGLKTIPYKFDTPIPGTEKKLHCLAESSFDRLKAELTRIFQA